MAKNTPLEGKYMRFKFGELDFECQMDGGLTITANAETEDQCKPDFVAGGEVESVTWEESTVTTMGWSANVSAKQFMADAKAAGFNNLNIAEQLITNSNPYVEFSFMSNLPKDEGYTVATVISGKGYINNWALAFPTSGAATQDLEITGIGKPTFTKTPIEP